MHTCFWDIRVILVNICPNNFAVKLKQSVAWDKESGKARLPRDSVHSNIGRSRERTVTENTSRKLSVDLWPTIVENRLVYLSQVCISCSFSHLKNCQTTFILWLISSLNHLKMDLIFGWTPGEILNSVWHSTFSPADLNMRLGLCQSDKMEPILTVLEGEGWETGCGYLWIRHSLHLDISFL